MLPTSNATSKLGEQSRKSAVTSTVNPMFVKKYVLVGHERLHAQRSTATQTEQDVQKLVPEVRTAYPCSVYGAGELDEAQEDRPGGQYTLRIREGEAVSIRYFNLTWKWRTLRCSLAISKRVEADEIVLRHDGTDVDDGMLIPQPRPGGVIEVEMEVRRMHPAPNPPRDRSRSPRRRDVGVQVGPPMGGAGVLIHIPHRDEPLDLHIRATDLPEAVAWQDITPSQLEVAAMQVYGYQLRRLGIARLCFVDGQRAMRPHEPLRLQSPIMPTVRAYPCSHQGAAEIGDQYRTALDLAKWAISGELSSGQLRLLLRGEPPLQKRLIGKNEKKDVRDILLAAARRYQMQTQMNEKSMGQVVKEQPKDTGKWTEVSRRKARSPTPAIREEKNDMALLACDWDVPVREEVRLGQPAVYLAQTLDHGRTLEKQLTNATVATAIVSMERLRKARSSEKQTLRVKELRDGRERERLVEGYVCHMSEQQVQHRFQIRQATTTRPQSKSVVLSMCMVQQSVENEEWSKLQSITNVKQLNEAYSEDTGSEALDIFRIQCIDGVYQALVRVKEADAEAWMRSAMPCTCSPMGEATKDYKLLWDKTVTTLSQARARFSELPGYAGCVCTRQGNFAGRIKESKYVEAAHLVGRTAGDLYRVLGLPIDLELSEVNEVLKDVGWQVDTKEGSQRIRRGTATWLVTATTPPPSTGFCVAFGHGELVRIQVESAARTNSPPSKPVEKAPTTWAQVASRALGSIKTEDEKEETEKHYEQYAAEDEDESMHSNEPEAEASDGPPVIHVAARPKAAPKRDPRMETLEQSVAELRVEMQNLIQNLIQGQGPPMTQHSKRPAAPEDMTGKGKLPWDEGLFSTVQWTDVPKDGNCVALAKCSCGGEV